MRAKTINEFINPRNRNFDIEVGHDKVIKKELQDDFTKKYCEDNFEIFENELEAYSIFVSQTELTYSIPFDEILCNFFEGDNTKFHYPLPDIFEAQSGFSIEGSNLLFLPKNLNTDLVNAKNSKLEYIPHSVKIVHDLFIENTPLANRILNIMKQYEVDVNYIVNIGLLPKVSGKIKLK